MLSSIILLFLLPLVHSSDITDRVDEMAEAMMSCLHVPGLSLAVVHKGDVVMQKGYGLADVEEGIPVTKDTLFPIASTTKAFTSTLLAMLLNESSYTWDTPVQDIIGKDFQLYTAELTRHVTLRDMLSHRTGLPGNFVPMMAGYPQNMTLLQLIRTMKYHKPVAPFRTSFIYNNFMYAVAGYIAELLGKASWEALTRDHIFKPLGMTSSTFIKDKPYKGSRPFAQPYVLDNGEVIKVETDNLHQVDASPSAGAIVSSAADMSRWLLFHLAHGKDQNGHQLITRQELEETYKEQMPAPSPMNERDLWQPEFPVTDVHTAYGLAWMTNIYRGYKRLWHSGGITTYKSQVWLYPHLDLGIFVAVNGPPTSGTTWGVLLLLHYITDVMVDETTPWLNTSTICSFPAPWKHVTRPNAAEENITDDDLPRDIMDYAGVYSHPGFGNITIVVSNGTTNQRLQLHMGRFVRCLMSYSSTDAEFSCQLQGSLAYMAQALLVRIRASQGTSDAELDILQIPFYSHADTAIWTNFTRGSAQPDAPRQLDGATDCYVSTAPTVTLHTIYIVPFVLFIISWHSLVAVQ